ncbi:MAG: hypothetical protein JKY42_01155 [Flavobacteriales bacterium]|nr:hypothetical protein [Flavobacteriales bacterium]
MRKWFFLFILFPVAVFAQESDHFAKRNSIIKKIVPNTRSTEIGLFGGVSYYNGDLNPASQFNPALTHWALGIIIRRNLSSRWSLRLNGMYGTVKGDDLISSSLSQQARGVSFQSKIYELSGQAEFNFFPYCVANDIIYFSPYLFVGLGAFRFNPTASTDGGGQELSNLKTEGISYSKISPVLPFGVGIKAKLSNRFLFGIEWGQRKTWTDYIDDVSASYESSGRQRGNSKINDYYSFAGVTLTIRLGPKLNSCWHPNHN